MPDKAPYGDLSILEREVLAALRAYANLERSNADLRRENAELRAELESYERAARRERAADRASDRY